MVSLVFSCSLEQQKAIPHLFRRRSVYRSNVIKGNLNPKWEAARLPLETICNGDMTRSMKVVVRDYHSRFGKHYEMGEFETTMQQFIDCKNAGGDVDEDVAFKLRRGDNVVGHVLVLRASAVLVPIPGNQVREPAEVSKEQALHPQFLDYLSGGCQISLAVAIDFTASNGKHHALGVFSHFSRLT